MRRGRTFLRARLDLFPMFLAAVLLLLSGNGEKPLLAEESNRRGSLADQAQTDKYPARMRTRQMATVRRWLDEKSSIMVAKIRPGAVLRMRHRGYRSPSCPEGWLEREAGGFVCGKDLQADRHAEPGPSSEDSPDLWKGVRAVQVIRNYARAYQGFDRVRKKGPFTSLKKGSILTVEAADTFGKREYFRTRSRWLVDVSEVALLPPVSQRLGFVLSAGAPLPGGIVTASEAEAFEEPGDKQGQALARWSVLPSLGGQPLLSEDGWVALPGGQFVRDEQVSRVRPAPRPDGVAAGERWIAVDLAEQLLQAYEGERLVFIAPCSTGVDGNTEPGNYRIARKCRAQTLRPEPNLWVEDVQWLMYYDSDKGIAIHSAYWHDDFGAPASHGCVNLAREDARWLFDWSLPASLPEESERYAVPGEASTRVIVFR